MRVGFFLFFPSTMWAPGGGEVQVLKTKQALESIGVEVVLLDPWSRHLNVDVVHVFGSNWEVYGVVEAVKGMGLPVVVSTISFSSKPSWQWRLWKLIDRVVPVMTTYRLRQRIYDRADILIVASRSEGRQLSQGFRVEHTKFRVVPLGVDTLLYQSANPDLFINKFGISDFVLEVGRINRHKGQSRLIRALQGTGLHVVLIGPPDPRDLGSFHEIQELSRRYEWVHYLGTIDHDDPLLASAYSAARVHVLPSVSESFGLVTFEALAAGTAAVSGPYPPVQEHLGQYVYFCDPLSIKSIRKTVIHAYERGPDPRARYYVLKNFSWDRVAQRLLNIYREVAD